MARTKQTEASGPVKARVLVDCEHGKCETLAVFETEAEAKIAEAAGLVDTHPDAVAYIESQG